MVDGEALLVALADFGEDVDPGLGLHTVVGLDIQSSLWLDHLKHLGRPQLGSERPPGKVSCLGHEGPQREGLDRPRDCRGRERTGLGGYGAHKGLSAAPETESHLLPPRGLGTNRT